ncbi:MAG: hypothetical protein EOM20_05975 [Spartobacteria bacterium]|nr:hypothetical protein [Spartobacteria bacterium]
MSKYISMGFLVGLTVVSILAGGCTTASMQVPSALQGVPVLAVTGRSAFRFNESFQFGPYAVTDVKRGWTSGSSWGLMGFRSTHKNQQYEFSLVAADAEWKAQCATRVSRKDLEQNLWGGELTAQLDLDSAFICTLHSESTGATWKMLMSRKTGQAVMDGTLSDGVSSITVSGTRSLKGSSIELSTATGYTFEINGSVVAAVQVINNGAIWLVPSIPRETQDLLAAAATALILYDDIGKN